MEKVNIDPLPSLLSREIEPPNSSTNFLHIESPNPDPVCVSEFSICIKGVNSFFWSSLDIPMPLSSTVNCRR